MGGTGFLVRCEEPKDGLDVEQVYKRGYLHIGDGETVSEKACSRLTLRPSSVEFGLIERMLWCLNVCAGMESCLKMLPMT